MDKNAIAGPYRFSFWESFSRVIEAIDDYAEIGLSRGGSRREGFGEAPEVIVDYGGDLIGWDETSISRDLK